MAGSLRLAAIFALALALGCKNNDKTPGPGGTIACQMSSECPSNLPMCDPMSHVCVGCLADFQTCGPGLTCDDSLHMCVPASPGMKCVRTADCPRPGVDPASAIACEKDAGVCVGCVSNIDCVAPDVCVLAIHTCGDPCMLCSPGQVCNRDLQRCDNVDGGSPD